MGPRGGISDEQLFDDFTPRRYNPIEVHSPPHRNLRHLKSLSWHCHCGFFDEGYFDDFESGRCDPTRSESSPPNKSICQDRSNFKALPPWGTTVQYCYLWDLVSDQLLPNWWPPWRIYEWRSAPTTLLIDNTAKTSTRRQSAWLLLRCIYKMIDYNVTYMSCKVISYINF